MSFNPAMKRIFGYRAIDVIGKNVSILMPEPMRGEHDGYLHNYQVTKEPHIIGKGREVEAIRKDGMIIPVDLRICEMELGEELRFIATMRDISARKQAEQRIMHLATHDPPTDMTWVIIFSSKSQTESQAY